MHPKILEAINPEEHNPPASKEEIEQAEQALGITFLPEVREFYLRSNGVGDDTGHFGFSHIMNLADVVEVDDMWLPGSIALQLFERKQVAAISRIAWAAANAPANNETDLYGALAGFVFLKHASKDEVIAHLKEHRADVEYFQDTLEQFDDYHPNRQ